MKLRTILTLIIAATLIYITLDFITLTATWRFYGWEMFTKSDGDVLPKSLKLGGTVPHASTVPSNEGIFPDSPYFFSSGWHQLHIDDWEKHLKELKGKPNIHALEIGSYEGFSAIWQLENILTDPTSTITCIDIFDDIAGIPIEARFDRNIAASGLTNKVIKIKGASEKVLRGLDLEKYDYVYIDGYHMPKWVLTDAVLSFDLLKKGGLMIFDDYHYIEEKPKTFCPTKIVIIDDYLWKKRVRSTHSPEPAIDAFLKIYEPYCKVVFKKFQVVVQKL